MSETGNERFDPPTTVDELLWPCSRMDGPRAGEHMLVFESWSRLSSLLTPERRRVLRRLKEHPEPSIADLAEALGRTYGCVHEDVSVLEMAGLIERSGGGLRVAADRLVAVVDL